MTDEQRQLNDILRHQPQVNSVLHAGTPPDWETSCTIGLRSVVFSRTGTLVCAQYPLNLDGHHRVQVVHQNGRSLSEFGHWVVERLSGPYAHLIPSDIHDI